MIRMVTIMVVILAIIKVNLTITATPRRAESKPLRHSGAQSSGSNVGQESHGFVLPGACMECSPQAVILNIPFPNC